jgi:aquaporin Z
METSEISVEGSEQCLQFVPRPTDRLSPISSLPRHWPEYLMELGELGCYLLVACVATTLLQHPASIVRQFVSSSLARRCLMGLAMGATTIAIVMSPWGKRSGGHFNAAITFTFYRLGKVEFWDGLFYVFAQLLNAVGGVTLARYVLRGALSHNAVHYAVTVLGVYGSAAAFTAELTMSFFLMVTVLFATNHERLAPYTAYFVGALIAMFYPVGTALSGMSTNPARSFGPAVHANSWHALWIYFIAPTVGMLAAAETFLRIRRGVAPYCAKLHHANHERCIFHHTPQLPQRTSDKGPQPASEGSLKRCSAIQ